MKIMLTFICLALSELALGSGCMNLSGRYKLVAEGCQGQLVSDYSFPTSEGSKPLAQGDIIVLSQLGCEKLDIELNQQKFELSLETTDDYDVYQSNYGFIFGQELMKHKACPSYYKKGKCAKFNITTNWNIDLIGNGNLVIKMNQEVKKVGVFRLAHKVKQICELERL